MDRLIDSNSECRLSVRTMDRRVLIDRLPSAPCFNEVLLCLRNASGHDIQSKVYPRVRNIMFCPEGLTPGNYSLHVFTRESGIGLFYSYYGSTGIPMHYDGRCLSIRESPYCVANSHFLQNIPQSPDFLSKCLLPTDNIQCQSRQIREWAERETQGCFMQYSKMRRIHDAVAHIVAYDADALIGDRYQKDDLSSLSVLQGRKTVCSGYHNLTSALLRACGIPAVGIVCFALGVSTKGWWDNHDNNFQDSNHIITAAFAGDKWRLMDVTWDSDNLYENGRMKKADAPCSSWCYFDPTIEFMSLTHKLLRYRL